MKIGSLDITDLKIGTTEINEVRLGSVLVWERSSYVYLVDTYSPVAAYSLRKLSSTATLAIRVRRSSDNAETDIGFIGNDLDTAALLSFVGAGNGLITKWYDQAGLKDFAQGTATIQPFIISSGSIVMEGGLPSILFRFNSTSSDSIVCASVSLSSAVSVFSACSFYDGANRRVFLNENPSAEYILLPDTVNPSANASNPVLNTAFIDTVSTTVTTRSQTRAAMLGKRMLISFFNHNMSTFSNYEIGRPAGALGALDNYQELLIFNTDQSANRTAIETNINTYYGIY